MSSNIVPASAQTTSLGTLADAFRGRTVTTPTISTAAPASGGVDEATANLHAELARLKAENQAMRDKASKPKTLSMKVSEKGGLSVYGLGRFPVTLYVQQWERLIGVIDEVKEFIEANRSVLKVKE